MSINCKQILYLAAAILLSLPVVSCSSTKSNTHTYRPYHGRRNRGGSAHEDSPGNPCLWVKKADGEEVLLPLHEDLVLDVDEPRKILKLTIPEGILDL